MRFPPEEPVPRVLELLCPMSNSSTFVGSRPMSSRNRHEVVVEILLVEREAHLLVHLLERRADPSARTSRRCTPPPRSRVGGEAGERDVVAHSVILSAPEANASLTASDDELDPSTPMSSNRRDRSRRVTFSEAAVFAHADCVGGPRALKRQTGTDLDDGALLRRTSSAKLRASANWSGSNVSRRSHFRVSSSCAVRGR